MKWNLNLALVPALGHEGRYYFIAPAAGGVEVFAHRNNVFGGTLKVGDKVRYMLRRSTHRRDKFEAYDVAVIEDAANV